MKIAARILTAVRSLTDTSTETGPDGRLLPPPRLRTLVAGGPDPEWYVEGGRLGAASILNILESNALDIPQFGSILDFGCGCGRVISHWPELTQAPLHGCDLNSRLLRWSRRHLAFATFQLNKLAPPLLYESESFDLVYGLSVLTHLPATLQRRWVQELTRVLKSGGYLILSTHGDAYLEEMTDVERQHYEAGELVVRDGPAGSNECAVFHPSGILAGPLTEGLLRIDRQAEGAIGNPRQDLTLLRKPQQPPRS